MNKSSFYPCADENGMVSYNERMEELPKAIDTLRYYARIPEIEKDMYGWYTLYCGKDTKIIKNGYSEIKLGISLNIPKDCAMLITLYHSTTIAFGIVLLSGVEMKFITDSNKELSILVYNTGDQTFIPEGATIGRFKLIKIEEI